MKPDTSTIDIRAMALLIILCASWGLNQVAIKAAVADIPPVLQAGIRSMGATCLMLVWMTIKKKSLLEKDGTLVWGLICGLLFSAEFVLIYWGLEFTNASRSTIFLNTSPFVVALGAHLFIRAEYLSRIQIIGMVLAFAGILVAFFTYVTWFWLIRTYPVSRLAPFTFLTPLFGVLAGSWLLGETVTIYLLCALAMVGAGIYLVNRR
jgi:drug/metabolite transporter (DMT)-like permease